MQNLHLKYLVFLKCFQANPLNSCLLVEILTCLSSLIQLFTSGLLILIFDTKVNIKEIETGT